MNNFTLSYKCKKNKVLTPSITAKAKSAVSSSELLRFYVFSLFPRRIDLSSADLVDRKSDGEMIRFKG